MTALASKAKTASLTGLEFSYGIPGSVGGAVVMNAGAYGGQVSDVLESCTLYDGEKCELRTLRKDEMDLSYRHSIFSANKKFICISATFTLKEGNKDEESYFLWWNSQGRCQLYRQPKSQHIR